MQQKTVFMHSGLVLSVLQIAAFAFSTPPFQGGVWFIAEPLMAAHFFIAAAIFVWLAYGYHKDFCAIPRNAFSVVLGLWILLQLASVMASGSPWRAWFASPANGEGTAWWLALLAGTLLTATLWRENKYHLPLICVAALTTVTLSGLHYILHHSLTEYGELPHAFAPNNWPDYLAFFTAYLWLIYCASSFREKPLGLLAIIATCLFALLHSGNNAAIALLCPALLVSVMALASPAFKRIFKPAPHWRALACIACVLPAAWWGYSFYFTHTGVGYAGEESLFAARYEGMGSRVLLNKVAIETLIHEPSRLLVGNGFGHFTDDLFKYGLVEGTTIFRDGVRNPNWFLLDGTAYHSHSQPLEVLLSFGIAGLLLFLALPVTLLLILPKPYFWPCAPMIVALTALSYFWFEIPHVLGIHALAFGALLAVSPSANAPGKRGIVWVVCITAALAMLWSGWQQIQSMQYGNVLLQAARNSDCTFREGFLASDIPRGAERFNEIATGYTIDLTARAKRQELRDGDTQCMQSFFETAQKISGDDATADYAASLWLQLHYELFLKLHDDAFRPIRQQANASFADAAINLAARAPLRDDKAAIFLITLGEYTNHDVTKQVDILERMLKVSPTHRSAQWLMGYFLAQAPETREEGQMLQNDAIARGVGSVFVVGNAGIEPATR